MAYSNNKPNSLVPTAVVSTELTPTRLSSPSLYAFLGRRGFSRFAGGREAEYYYVGAYEGIR